MRRRGALLGALLGAGALGVSMGSPRGAAARTTLERVRESGVLRVGVVGGQPPYSWRDVGSSRWTGFMVDVAADFAAGLGASIEPVESTWGNAALDVQAGKVDVFFGLAPTPQRALVVDFSVPLYQNAFALVARAGFSAGSWAELDRPEVRIALELGSVYDQNVDRLVPRATVTRLKTNTEALLSVQSGRADCQMLVVILALTALSRNRSIGHLVVPEPLFGSPTCAMLPKEATGEWRETLDGWLGRRRGEGWIRRTLVSNLERTGVRGEEVPSQLLF